MPQTITFRSFSDLADIHAEKYLPEQEVKAVIQIAHGMAEHHKRYEDFISFLTANGYAVYMNDHLGHGKSVSNDNELGYFGEKDGCLNLVEDMKKLNDIIHKEFPDKPVFLFGHSMGSMLSRVYTEKYPSTIKAVVYCGTCGSNPAAGIGLKIVNLIAKIKGSHHRSEFINNLAFGTYNNRFKPNRTPFDWLTKENDIVDKYIEDKYCGFLFTAYGYRDLMKMITVINRKEWYAKVPKELPIYIIAGADDPVGNYGKGIDEVSDGLINTGHNAVTKKIYANDRHEILNETDKADVYADILSWFDNVIIK